MATIQAAVLARLDALITKGKQVVGASYVGDMGFMASRLPEEELRAFLAGASAAVEHIAGRDSEFFKQVPRPEKGHLAAYPQVLAGALGAPYAARPCGWWLVRTPP